MARTRLYLRPCHLDRRSAASHAGEDGAPGETKRLELLHVRGAAAGGEVLCQKLVEGDGAGTEGNDKRRDQQQDSHATSRRGGGRMQQPHGSANGQRFDTQKILRIIRLSLGPPMARRCANRVWRTRRRV